MWESKLCLQLVVQHLPLLEFAKHCDNATFDWIRGATSRTVIPLFYTKTARVFWKAFVSYQERIRAWSGPLSVSCARSRNAGGIYIYCSRAGVETSRARSIYWFVAIYNIFCAVKRIDLNCVPLFCAGTDRQKRKKCLLAAGNLHSVLMAATRAFCRWKDRKVVCNQSACRSFDCCLVSWSSVSLLGVLLFY